MDIAVEFDYMRGFIDGADFFDEIPLKQLWVLWTAFCFHNNLDADTGVYDSYLRELWEALLHNSTSGFEPDDFEQFDIDMAKYLI